MKKKIEKKFGITIESSILDEQGELERERLMKLAMQEYDDTGALSSEKLLEANKQFLDKAKKYVLDENADVKYDDD